ncbi:MAG: hypothetical protein HC910_09100 [Spirulinaceae cyanobacterium SM2_1_0]|nr:hypothetical protein [Spirulinaceae cyanobacterium SM2_1_0]
MRFPNTRQHIHKTDVVERTLSIVIAFVSSLVLGLTVTNEGPSWTQATQIQPVLLGEVGLWGGALGIAESGNEI